YFDVEIVLTLQEYPRAYRFYFSHTPEHRRLVAVFDRYLEALDLAESVARHEEGEGQPIKRYVAQRNQQILLQVAGAQPRCWRWRPYWRCAAIAGCPACWPNAISVSSNSRMPCRSSILSWKGKARPTA